MDALEALLTNRAMRRYTDEPVTDAEVWTCLRAAIQGPSGGNIQPWRFQVVRDPDLKTRIAALYQRAYARYERALLASHPGFRSEAERESFERTLRASRHLAGHLAETPVLVLVWMAAVDLTLRDAQGPLDIGSVQASVYPAVQNLLVAARALGIGTALTTVARVEGQALREACGAPDRFELAALVPMGRPRGRFGVAPRKPVEAVTYWDRWGERRPAPPAPGSRAETDG